MYIFYLYMRNTIEWHISAFLFPTFNFWGHQSHGLLCKLSVPPPQCHPSAKSQNSEKLLLPVLEEVLHSRATLPLYLLFSVPIIQFLLESPLLFHSRLSGIFSNTTLSVKPSLMMPFIRTSFPSPILGHSCSRVCTIFIHSTSQWLNLLLFTPLLSVFFHWNVNTNAVQALFCSLYSQGLKQCLVYSRCSIISFNKWWMYDSCKKNPDFTYIILFLKGLAWWLSEKNPPANAGDMG